MASPALPLALQPAERSLPVPGSYPAPLGVRAAAPCDSCQSAPATYTLTWPDARFRVCSLCLPQATPAGSVLGVVALPVPCLSTAPSTCSSATSASTGPQGASGAPARAMAASAARLAGPAQPAASAAAEHAEREVLHTAAHTVLTSPPSPRGRRLSREGGCDVVAALVLAAGGAVDQTGRPAEPAERPAGQLLRRVLRRVADQLAGCAPGHSWTGDPVALIDAWQAYPGLARSARAAVLDAAARSAPDLGRPSSPASAAAAARAAGDGRKAAHRRPVPTSTAALEHWSDGARS